MNIFKTASVLLCAAGLLCAVETKTWQQGEMADFEKGTLTRLSLASDGRLALAPVVKEIFDPSVAFLWAVARDSKGNLYAGGGGLGGTKTKLFMVDPSGKSKTLAELEGIAIQAIAIDSHDRVYAATSPDGKVYRIETQTGKSEVFYDPKQKYIWALEFSRSGDLFVATGDQGEIHRVTPAGVGSVFFKTEETHARSMAIDPNGNLIVGTDPGGLILRIRQSDGQAGEGFVLYQAPKREITAVAAAPDGTIYAAGVGNKQAPVPAPAPVQIAVTGPNAAAARAPAPPTLASAAPAIAGGSEIYRIQTDGYPRKIWSHAQDLVYALAFDGRGRVMAATGNHGDIYRLETDHKYWKLVSLASTQVTAFCAGAGGKLYAVTGNIGKIFSIGPEQEQTGIFESDIFDAGAFSYWGRVTTSPRENTAVTVETRSGNLDRAQKNWNGFARTNNGRVVSAPARFLQYKLTMSGPGEVTEVDVAYQMKNVAPEIDEVEITPANYKFPAPSNGALTLTPSLTLPALGHQIASSSSMPAPAADSGSSPAMSYAKGQIGVRWLASDDNGDSMLFKVEIRGANETSWKLLKDKIREHYYSWDSTAFPDGKYFVRITATDAPSNPPDQSLTASAGSEPFLIDNTAPEITGLTGTPSGAKLEVRFHAKDAMSALSKAEYSINGGDWMVVEPTTRLTDSLEHDYRVQVDRAGETTVAVRVSDENDNQSVAKIVVK
jgi:sugar lactone lactonase YvrE